MVIRIPKKANNFKYFIMLLPMFKLPFMSLYPQFEIQYNVILVLFSALLLLDLLMHAKGSKKMGIFAVCMILYNLSMFPVSVSGMGDPVVDAVKFYGSALYHIVFTLALLYYLEVDARNLIHVWRIILEVLTIANVLTVFFLPDGIYSTGTGISQIKFWLFGYDNDHFVVYSITLLVVMLDQYLNNGKVLSKHIVILFLITNISLIYLWSVTSFLSLLLMTILIFAYKFAAKNPAVFNMRVFVFIIIIFLIIVFYIASAGNAGNIISNFLVNTLQKDITFNSRSRIWQRYFALFKEYPLFGNGYESAAVRFARVGGVSNAGAHNEWIRMLYDGGLFHFCCYIAMLYVMVNRMMRYRGETITYLISVVIFAVSINETMVEFFEIYWLSLYVFGYRCAEIIRCKETKYSYLCTENGGKCQGELQ